MLGKSQGVNYQKSIVQNKHNSGLYLQKKKLTFLSIAANLPAVKTIFHSLSLYVGRWFVDRLGS
jgi:hypothetical protein